MVASKEAAFAYFLQPMIDGTFVTKDPGIIKWTPFVLDGILFVRGSA